MASNVLKLAAHVIKTMLREGLSNPLNIRIIFLDLRNEIMVFVIISQSDFKIFSWVFNAYLSNTLSQL